jgi:metallo-beta-lactamase class B
MTLMAVTAQEVKEPKTTEEWTRPYSPFQIAGNLYYVGTYDLACYLITTSQGHILINTGLAASEMQIKKNIETLGYRFSDLKILLTTQAHYDHMGAMASIKKSTGAKLMVNKEEADVVTSGGSSDYELGKYGVSFHPVKPDRLLQDGDSIRLGEMKLVLLHHPGHTKGSSSYLFTVRDGQKSYRVLIANMPTIVVDRQFDEIAGYPSIKIDYQHTFDAMQKISFDIWLASHASQFNLHEKHKPGDAYHPSAFIDHDGYFTELNDLKRQFEEKLEKDKR